MLNNTFMLYALKSNIHYIRLAVLRTMNASIILLTHWKLLLIPCLRFSSRCGYSLLYLLLSNIHRLSIAAYSSLQISPVTCSAFKTTIKCAILMMDNKIDRKTSSLQNPFPARQTPNTANAHTNAISVLCHCIA